MSLMRAWQSTSQSRDRRRSPSALFLVFFLFAVESKIQDREKPVQKKAVHLELLLYGSL